MVILDCDGVLVDSERITTSLLAEAATGLGWPITTADALRLFKGRDLRVIQGMVEARIGRELDGGFITSYRERMASAFEAQGVPTIPGASALLDRLDARGIPHAVASNGPQEKMRLTLGRIGTDRWPGGWFERFHGRLFSAYDVGVWKPDPGLFLHASRVMGVEASVCVVVEDSPSGVEAAVAAGMRVIGLADLTPPEVLFEAGAYEVCPTLSEVKTVLETWIA